MAERVWERYLTEQDKAHLALAPAPRKGGGSKPALLLVDMYRWVFGDEPEPLIKAVKTWPGSCGLSGWEALPHIQRLLTEARALGIPVVHIWGMENVPGWRDTGPRDGPKLPDTEASRDRKRRHYDLLPEVAPIEGELQLRKKTPSVFLGTPLAALLYGLRVDTVVVAGETTSGCVRASVVDAKSYRFKVIVPEECVFDRHEAAHAINLFDMDQKYADVIPVDETVEYLISVAAEKVPA